MRKTLLAVAICLLAVQTAWGGTVYGKVQKVIDGDTLDVQISGIGKVERVRIYGINAPERGGEPYYKAAKEFTAKMTEGKRVKFLNTRTREIRKAFGFRDS